MPSPTSPIACRTTRARASQNFTAKADESQVFFITLTHPAGLATVSGEAVRIPKK